MLIETSYAIVRRLQFIENEIRRYINSSGLTSVSVADIGCGTGELLTIPLALDLGEEVDITACEPDEHTLQQLCDNLLRDSVKNVAPIRELESIANHSVDIVIASEVLEHVDNPGGFLADLKRKTKPSGMIILTMPNGYGIFEFENMLFNTLELIGVIPFLRLIKGKLIKTASAKVDKGDTIANSPHINFFSLPDIRYLLSQNGLSITKITGKQFMAGPFSDRILGRNEALLSLNNKLGEILPLVLVSAWMIIVKPDNDTNNRISLKTRKAFFVNTIYCKFKRFQNTTISRRIRN